MPAGSAPSAPTSVPVKDQDPQNLKDPGVPGSGGPGGDSWEEWAHQVRHDLLTIIWWLGKHVETVHLSGPFVVCPVAGQVRVYGTSLVAVPLSGVNYYTIAGTRQGNASSLTTVGTNVMALPAYQEVFLGEFTVAQGDVLGASFVATGAPAPTLNTTNFVIRCELTERVNYHG